VKRYLYVTNDAERRVDIFDIGLGERGETPPTEFLRKHGGKTVEELKAEGK
jgi:hypothetical protein